MTTEQALVGNRVIGRFLGFKINPNGFAQVGKMSMDFNELNHSGCPCYHHSFGWLMSVWENIAFIQSLNDVVGAKVHIDDMGIGGSGVSIKAFSLKVEENKVREKFISFEVIEDCGEGNEHLTNKNLLDCVYKVCVEFILWYEKQ